MVEGEAARFDAMKAADVALACSGTVTTELALAGCPMVVGYRMGAVTYAIIRPLITAPYASLINIAAGAEIAPELIQSDCTGPTLAKAVGMRLDDPDLRRRQIAAQDTALERMGRGCSDPSETAARKIAELLEASRS